VRFEDALTDGTVLRELGGRIARLRLDRNLTQQQLADEAGISRHTLLRLEDGHSVTLSALLRVLRALNLLGGLEVLVPEPLPSPLEELERGGLPRQRASGAQADDDAGADAGAWQWGTP
jgi:transcriptional regulator with XRE-family HTH domain